MKKLIVLLLAMAMAASIFACTCTAFAASDESASGTEASGNFTDEMKIPYAIDLSEEDGADSVEREGDHQNSPYFASPDYYNMVSTDTLTILSHFQTIQYDTTDHNQDGFGVYSAERFLSNFTFYNFFDEETDLNDCCFLAAVPQA